MGATALLMQCIKIVNWVYNAIDVHVCMYVDNVAPELNIIDRICVCQCLCLCAFHDSSCNSIASCRPMCLSKYRYRSVLDEIYVPTLLVSIFCL